MPKLSAPLRAAAIFVFALSTHSVLAVETHVWDQSDQSDFARGTAQNLSIRSDGRITVAPQVRELDSTSLPYLWTLAQDSKSTVYYAGGSPTGATTKIYSLSPGGKPKAFAELTGLEVHALAVDPHNVLYAAVQPDAKIYRLDASGKPQLFFDPKCKYVWSMAFDRGGNLFVATGDSGLIYRVTPDGNGKVFFDTEETHARSMTIDSGGNLIIGTEPSGLVLRITPQGESFVLYQTTKREVTAVAEHDGQIFAAAVGNKLAPAQVSGPAPVLPSNNPAISSTGTPRSGSAPPSLPPSVGSISVAVAGGSEVFRIEKSGYAERIWSSSTDLAYALAFDSAGKPLIGTGNKGAIYRVDSENTYTQVLNTPPTQVTILLNGKDGIIYAGTGNVGNLYSIAPALETKGTFTSEVLDAREFSSWGKVHITATLRDGSIALETRSGNVANPQKNWSSWTAVAVKSEGGAIQSPAARFLQYRLVLGCSSAVSPEVSAVDIAYLARNVAPRIGQIEVAPFNYRLAPSALSLERSVVASGSPSSLTLPAVGQRRTALSASAVDITSTSTLQYTKGFVTLRWTASDANGDPLLFRVELRLKSGGPWRMVKEKLTDRFWALDSTAFPDGEYIARITASDVTGNVPSEALSSSLESDPFHIDNTPPEIIDAKISGTSPHVVATFTAKDVISWIDKAEYSLNGNDWIQLNPVNKVTDSQVLSYRLPLEAGQTVAVRVFDENDNVVVRQFTAP